jgi:DNA-binding CsgD family transcriptional regulator
MMRKGSAKTALAPSGLMQGPSRVQDRAVSRHQRIRLADLRMGAHLMKEPWPKAFDAETIASIQTIQDSLASLSTLYIAVLDGAGAPLTIPSNQAGPCTECHGRFAEAPCLPNVRQAIAEAGGNRITTQARCPFGLMTYYSPLGTVGGPSRGGTAAILAIGRMPAADRRPEDAGGPPSGSSAAAAEKAITTYGKIFDLIFSLAMHAGPAAAAAAPPPPAAPTTDIGSLSVREREVLHLVSLGLSNQAIADRLFISEATVKTHLHNISRKVKISNRTSLALFFLQST